VTDFRATTHFALMSQRDSMQRPEVGETASLASILHNCLHAGVIVVDDRDHILFCSPEAAGALGLPPMPATGGNVSALPAPVQKLVRDALALGRAITGNNLTLARDEDPTVLRIDAQPFRSVEGRAQVVLTLHHDALIERLEHNLNRLDRLAGIGTLSAGMAHEIKNAFVAVKTFVDLLLEKNPDAELGDVVRRELRRIDSIVSQMLRFRSPARPSFAVVRVHDVLDHSLRLLQPQFDSKLIHLSRGFSASQDAVQGDDYQLEQAFVNLFFNALEAMGPNGSLTVSTENIGPSVENPNLQQVRITITDNGIGIPPENMSHLFEPFFTTKENGTGLGMAITRRIIREHHGDISAQSERNHGTTFQVLLPAHAIA
jgi:two-component system, NtrC family, sensor histidine kinase HydH